MRAFFVVLAGIILTQATISKADSQEVDFDRNEAEFSDRIDAVDAPGWNRWTCTAKRSFILRMYRGSSYYFRDGSGEGQQAKLIAQKIAVRACEFASNGACTSNLAECTVESH